MKKRKLLSLLLAVCMTICLMPTVALAETATEYYNGDGTVYVPEEYEAVTTCWDLNTMQIGGNGLFMTQGDKLTWTSEMITSTSGTGIHNPGWCYYEQDKCGHYGEPTYSHVQYLGFRLSGDTSTLSNLSAPVKVYSVDGVDETDMSNGKPANTMTKKEYEAVDSVTVLSYPTRIVYKSYGEGISTSKRCGVKNAANEFIAYDTYRYYVGGLLEVKSLSINTFPVKYNLQGGTMENGKTLPSEYAITRDFHVCNVNEPVKLGYTFNGWDHDGKNKYVYTKAGEIKTADVSERWSTVESEAKTGSIINATWIPSNVYISLNPNGGTIDGSSALKKLASIEYSATTGKDSSYFKVTPEKSGKEFLGWYVGDTRITCIDDIPQSAWNSSNSYTLTAKWAGETECSHKGGTATCTKKAVCDVCGQEYGSVDATNHTFKDGKCSACSAVDPDAATHTPIDTTKPVKDVEVGVAKDDVKEVEKVANTEANAIVEAVKAGKAEELKKNDIVEAKVIDAIVNAPAGSDVKVTTNVVAKPVEKSAVDEKAVALVVKGADKSTVVQYLDLSVMVNVVVDGTVTETGELKQLSKPITFTIAVPEELKAVEKGMERTYYVIRVHGDEVTKLPVTVNEDGTLSFQTDRFSTYALAYTDTAKTTETPKTGDAANMLPWLALMAVAAAGAATIRKKEN